MANELIETLALTVDGMADDTFRPFRVSGVNEVSQLFRFEIDVVDLSPEGFRAETSFTLWPGTIVWLTLPGLAPLEAVIAWRDRFKYGCAFSKPLHPAVFEHIVALGNR